MKKSILFNRTLHLVSYVLLSLTSCLFVSCDKDDDWDKNLGNNLLEGIWTRESTSQKFVATFNADHTSYICTYNIRRRHSNMWICRANIVWWMNRY